MPMIFEIMQETGMTRLLSKPGITQSRESIDRGMIVDHYLKLGIECDVCQQYNAWHCGPAGAV